MAAPSSAHTRPSHKANSAPKIQPSMACGPPAAAMMSGMVMNGPTPIMSIMFSVVACSRPTPRISSGRAPLSSGGMSHAQQVDIEANRAGNSKRQLSEERIAGVDVVALAELRKQQAAFLRLLAGIVRGQQRREVRVPLVHEIQPALLHPAGKIGLRDRVRITEDFALRLQHGDGSLLD